MPRGPLSRPRIFTKIQIKNSIFYWASCRLKKDKSTQLMEGHVPWAKCTHSTCIYIHNVTLHLITYHHHLSSITTTCGSR